MTKSEFVFDCEEDFSALSAALSGLAEGDLPFLVELLFVGEEEIRRINREQRGIDRITDVLSFPTMELTPGEPVLSEEHGECVETTEEEGREKSTLLLGSVVVCRERARAQAEEYGHSYERELNYLIVHGVLHCLGYDHETESDKREMRKKEEEALARLKGGER